MHTLKNEYGIGTLCVFEFVYIMLSVAEDSDFSCFVFVSLYSDTYFLLSHITTLLYLELDQKWKQPFEANCREKR